MFIDETGQRHGLSVGKVKTGNGERQGRGLRESQGIRKDLSPRGSDQVPPCRPPGKWQPDQPSGWVSSGPDCDPMRLRNQLQSVYKVDPLGTGRRAESRSETCRTPRLCLWLATPPMPPHQGASMLPARACCEGPRASRSCPSQHRDPWDTAMLTPHWAGSCRASCTSGAWLARPCRETDWRVVRVPALGPVTQPAGRAGRAAWAALRQR